MSDYSIVVSSANPIDDETRYSAHNSTPHTKSTSHTSVLGLLCFGKTRDEPDTVRLGKMLFADAQIAKKIFVGRPLGLAMSWTPTS